jgi:hypothetical protein
VVVSSWKRVSLNARQLHSMFPSIHAHNIAQILSCLADLQAHYEGQINGEGTSRNGINSVQATAYLPAQVRILSAQQLLRAFHCAEYLYHPKDAVDMDGADSVSLPRLTPAVSSANFGLSKQSSYAVPNLGSAASAASFGTSSLQLTANAPSATASVAGSKAAAAVSAIAGRDILFQDLCFVIAM